MYTQDLRNLASWSDQLPPGGWLRNLIQILRNAIISLESSRADPQCILSRDQFMLRLEAEIFYELMPDALTTS